MRTRLFSLLLCSFVLSYMGCGDYETYTYDEWTPVYMPLSEFRSSVRTESPRELKDPGKIYIKDQFLFVNEREKGIHIYDNSDPYHPVNLSFVSIPGNGDIAVKGNTLYADSYIDLVALDISDIRNIRELKRIQSIFPQCLNSHGMWVDTAHGIAIDWKKETKTVRMDRSNPLAVELFTSRPLNSSGRYYTGRAVLEGDASQRSFGPGSNGSSGTSGVGGSMARFTIVNNTLYAVSSSDLQMFAIENPRNPLVWAKMNLGWNIETIFPYQDKLFIGSQTGMFIYDNRDQRNPVRLCQFNHGRSCDPVVVCGDLAYVTLRSGSACGGASNQLDVVDIKDLTNPKLIRSYAMQEPYGVGVDGSTVFVCDGSAGLKVYSSLAPGNLQLTSFLSDFRSYDIIPLGSIAIVVGPDGLYQYDYSNPAALQFMSKIARQ